MNLDIVVFRLFINHIRRQDNHMLEKQVEAALNP